MKSRRITSIFVSLLIVLSLFSGCTGGTQPANELSYALSSDAVLSAVSPESGATVSLHTEKQASYLERSEFLKNAGISGRKEYSRPEGVLLQWTVNGSGADEYIVSLSENMDMSDSVLYTTADNSIVLTNLKIAQTYYWCVSVDGVISGVYSFTTSGDVPRNISVEGVKNVRDLGGWEIENGTRTKQGLIYRCGRLNESSADEINIEITEQGKAVMLGDLGIKSEIDLRKTYDNEVGSIISSPLGDSVTYYPCPMEWDGDIFNQNKEQILKVFAILADENNYPLIFHCNIGTDRTGMIGFLVNALLGVSEDDLLCDYMFSNLADIGGTRKALQQKNSAYYKAVMSAKGDILSEKVYNCLADFGVPTEHLDSVIRILS